MLKELLWSRVLSIEGTPKSIQSRSISSWKARVAAEAKHVFSTPLSDNDLKVKITVFYNAVITYMMSIIYQNQYVKNVFKFVDFMSLLMRILKTIKLLSAVSTAEFLLPNLGSLIMGLAWGATPSISIGDLVVMIILSFAIINVSSAIGAQVNTLSDRELDSKDERKKQLVEAMNSFGANRLKRVLVIEFALTLILVFLFMLIQQKPILLLLWIVGICLGCAYSLPPTRFKSRSWLAPISLILVLAVFPVLFAYYTFTTEMNPFFLISITGLALTVYGVIVPTEIRDYFGDKAMGIETMTVRLGLVNASFLSIVLLTAGAILTGTAFFLEWAYEQHLWLSIFLLAILVAVIFVLGKFKKLHSLSKEFTSSKNQRPVAESIISLSAHNPQWIMLVTQTYSLTSIILLISKFFCFNTNCSIARMNVPILGLNGNRLSLASLSWCDP